MPLNPDGTVKGNGIQYTQLPFSGNFYDENGEVRNIHVPCSRVIDFPGLIRGCIPSNGNYYDENGFIRNIHNLMCDGGTITHPPGYVNFIKILDKKDRPISLHRFNRQVYAHISDITAPHLTSSYQIDPDGSVWAPVLDGVTYRIVVSEDQNLAYGTLFSDYFYLNEYPSSMYDVEVYKTINLSNPIQVVHMSKFINYSYRYFNRRRKYMQQFFDPSLTYTTMTTSEMDNFNSMYESTNYVASSYLTSYNSKMNEIFCYPIFGDTLYSYNGDTGQITEYPISLPSSSTMVKYIYAIENINGDMFIIPSSNLNTLIIIHPDKTITLSPLPFNGGYSNSYGPSIIGPNGRLFFLVNSARDIVEYDVTTGLYDINHNFLQNNNFGMSLGFNGFIYLKRAYDNMFYEYDWISKNVNAYPCLHDSSPIMYTLQDGKIYSVGTQYNFASYDIVNYVQDPELTFPFLQGTPSVSIRDLIFYDDKVMVGDNASYIVDVPAQTAYPIGRRNASTRLIDEFNGLFVQTRGVTTTTIVPMEYTWLNNLVNTDPVSINVSECSYLPSGDIAMFGSSKKSMYLRKCSRDLGMDPEALGGYVLDDI